MAPPKSIPVACALIMDQAGRVLLAQRPAHKHLALKWEFPGGKIEPGESADAALVREIDEELGCRIDIVRPLPPFVHHYETISVEMHPFVCRLAASSAIPVAREHAALIWARPAEVRGYDLAAADLPLLETPGFLITPA
jgi:8-oxo-dGTP diphosphatase